MVDFARPLPFDAKRTVTFVWHRYTDVQSILPRLYTVMMALSDSGYDLYLINTRDPLAHTYLSCLSWVREHFPELSFDVILAAFDYKKNDPVEHAILNFPAFPKDKIWRCGCSFGTKFISRYKMIELCAYIIARMPDTGNLEPFCHKHNTGIVNIYSRQRPAGY